MTRQRAALTQTPDARQARLAAQWDADAARPADRVTAALTQYGTLEAACTALEQQRQAAATRVQMLAAQVSTLQANRDWIQAGLAAVAADGSHRIAAAEAQALTTPEAAAWDGVSAYAWLGVFVAW